MKNKILKIGGTLGIVGLLLSACGPKKNPPLVYMPDMYFPVAYDPLEKAQDPYTKDTTQIPAFYENGGQTGLYPVDGTVVRNDEGLLPTKAPKDMKEYNQFYDESKLITESPLDPANFAKDVKRGEELYGHTCSACHGLKGDGQGPIVESGAYSGVPNYKDRDVTIGSVHYVLEYGRNNMGSFAGQLNPGDRWRVALYVMNEFKKQAAADNAATANANTNN